MKRLLTFAVLSLLALSSTAFAGKGSKHKPENQTNKPQPIIRDHRTQNAAPIVRDHRTTNAAPVVRDHRTSSGLGNQPPKLVSSGLGKQSGGGYVNVNGIVQRAPAVSKPLVPLTHPMSPRVPPRDPRTTTSQDLVSSGAKDQRFTPVLGTGPVVRDHRDQSGYGYGYSGHRRPNVSDMPGGVMVTNTNSRPGVQRPKPIDTKVTVAPNLSVRGPAPIVRDHRMTSATAANYNWPSINQNSSPVVRDHRGNGSSSASGGVTVTNSSRPRQPVDNTIYGSGPGLGSVVDAVGSGVGAVGNGLTKVGNVFGIGYGSVTSGAPTRPQVVDHRKR